MPLDIILRSKAVYGARLRALTSALLASLLCMQFACGQAQVAAPENVDLSSTKATVPASFTEHQTAEINVGGAQHSVTSGDVLTPAEHVALTQVLNSGHQTIELGSAGNAVGGTVNLSRDIGLALINLVIPQGVTAVRDFATASSFNLLGNLTNAGQLYAFSSNAAIRTATISATNINNLQGALLSSVLPASGLAGINNAVANLSLNLNAINNIVNAGTIASAGHLGLAAGGSIINALPPGATGPSPVMQALNNLNLVSNTLVNSGAITALAGNVNIQAMTASNLAINNVAGTMQALAGIINISSPAFAGKVDLNIVGGDFLSKELDLRTANGNVNVSVGNVTGTVNASACEVHVQAAADNLRLGTLEISGDPSFFNSAGNVTISQNLTFHGQPLAIVAKGNIITAPGAGAIDTSSNNNGNGGAITLIAGAAFTTAPANAGPVQPAGGSGGDTATQLTITGASSTGGNIDLTGGGASPINMFSSAGSGLSGNGGNIQLIAFGQASGNPGAIILPQSLTLMSRGGNGPAASNGNVTVIGSANSTGPAGITLGDSNTAGSPNGGTIFIGTQNPVLHNGQNVVILNGAVQSGSFDPGTTNAGFLSVGAINAGGGTSLTAGGDITLNRNLTTNGNNLAVVSSSNILQRQQLQINTLTNSGSGGSLLLVSGFDFNGSGPQAITFGSASGAGGSILLPNTTINTSSQQGANSAGSITAIASAGSSNTGLISQSGLTATANTNGASNGGQIRLISGGGVQVNGQINTSAATGGQLLVSGTAPAITGGTIIVTSGVQGGTGQFQKGSEISGAGAAVLVSGNINTSGQTGAGGSVSIDSDAQLEVNGGINTTGKTGPANQAGGGVTLSSLDSFVSIDQSGINTSALSAQNASSGIAGIVNIQAASRITVNGNIQAVGQSSTTGNGGNGGATTLQTNNQDSNNLLVGSIVVNGFIDTRGGNSSTVAGAGGSVTASSGTLQILQNFNGASIITSDGNNGAAGASVNLTTTESQTVPTNFDLTIGKNQTNNLIPAVPGGRFTIGVSNPVNGTAGSIVSGNNAVTALNSPVQLSTFTQGNISITAQPAPAPISIAEGGPLSIVPSGNSNGRMVLTPAEALAVYQVTHGQSANQITLNANGQNTPPPAGNTVSVASTDINQPFTLFNLVGVGATPNKVTLNVTGPTPLIILSGSSNIAGVLNFTDANSMPLVDFGNGGMNIAGGGAITGTNSTTLIFAGNGGNWVNNGTISAQNILFAPTSSLSFTMGNNAAIQAASGASNPTIIVSAALSSNINMSFTANAATFGLPVTFQNIAVPATYRNVAQAYALNFNGTPNVNLRFALRDQLSSPQTATIQGTLNASSLTLSTSATQQGQAQIPTPLTITGALSASQNVNIQTVGDLNMQTGGSIGSPTANVQVNTSGNINFIIGNVFGSNVNLMSSGNFNVNAMSILSASSNLQINSQGAVLVGGIASTIQAGSNLSITSQTGINLIGGSTFTAGSLASNAPPSPQPLTQSNIARQGQIQLSAPGSNFGISGVTLTTNGGDLSIQLGGNGGSTNFNGATLVANGGNIFINGNGQLTCTTCGFTSRLLNGGNGSVSISDSAGVTLTGSTFTVGGSVQISASNGAVGLSGTPIIISSQNQLQVTGATGVTLASGSDISNTVGQVTINSNNGLVTLNSDVQSGQQLSIQGQGGVTIGSTTSVTAGTNLQINASGSTAALTINAGAQISAGSLSGNQPFGPLTQSQIARQGQINIQAQGSGGLVFSGSGSTSFTSNGADLQLNAVSPPGGIAIPDSTTFTANGGSMNFSCSGPGTVTAVSNVTLQASTLNGSSGNIQINSQKALTFGPGSFVNALGQLQINVNNGLLTINSTSGNPSTFSADRQFNLQANSGITIGSDAQLNAGALVGNLPFGPLNQSDIASSGQLNIQAHGAGLNLLGPVVFTSNGGDIQINSSVPNTGLSFPAGTFFTANGGSISLNFSAQGQNNAPSTITAAIQASTLNKGSGNIQINFPSALTFGAGTFIGALGQLQINVNNGLLTINSTAGNPTSISSERQLNLQANAGITIGSDAQISAGSLAGNPPFGPLSQSDIASRGALNIQAQGAGLNLLGPVVFTSNGDDIQINSSVPSTGLTYPSGTFFTANGGSIRFNFSAQGQNIAASTITAAIQSSTVNKGSGNIQINFSSPLTFGAGSFIYALGQLQVSVNNGLLSINSTSGNPTTLASAGQLNLQANAGITIGSDAQISAGSLAGNPPFGPLAQTNIASRGSLNIQTQGAGLNLLGPVIFRSNGDDIQINSPVPNTGLTYPAGTFFTANGGSIRFNFSAQGQNIAASTITAALQASTLNNGSGNIQINFPSALAFGAGTFIGALGQLQINVSNGLLTINSTSGSPTGLSSAGQLNLQANAGITIGSDAQITAGTLSGNPAFGPLTQNQIASRGQLNIQAQGAGLNLLGPVIFTSNGDNIQITSSVPVTGLNYPNGTSFTANGGNVNLNLSAQGQGIATSTFTADLAASTVNGGSGNIQINFPSALTFGAGSIINALGQVQINVNNGAFTFSGSSISSTGGSLNIQGQAGVTVGTGASAGVTAKNQIQLSTSTGSLTVGNNVNMTSMKGQVNMQSPNNLTIGSGASATGATGVQLAANGSASTLTISGDVTAGAFVVVPPSFGPVVSSNVASAGSVQINANGSGGIVFQPSSTTEIASIGGNVTINTGGSAVNLTIGSGANAANITAHGGNVQINVSGQVTTNANGGINASTLNGTQGNVAVSSRAISMNGTVNALGAAALNANSSLTVGPNANLFGGSLLTLAQSGGATTMTIGAGATLTAGVLQNDTGTGTVNPANVVKAGSVALAYNGAANSGLSIGQGVMITSNAGDVGIISTGGIVLDSSSAQQSTTTVLRANGGNVIVMSQKTISQASNNSIGNTFIARAVGTSASNSFSGGIEIGSGPVSPQIQSVLNSSPRPNQPAGSLGPGVVIPPNPPSPNSFSIVANAQNGGVINLNGTGASPSTLTLTKGAIEFDAQGPGASVTINGGSFTTFSFRPIAFLSTAETSVQPASDCSAAGSGQRFETTLLPGMIRAARNKGRSGHAFRIVSEPDAQFAPSLNGDLHLGRGSIFIEAPSAVRIRTDLAQVYAARAALVQVESSGGRLHVRACSGVHGVSVIVAGNKVGLSTGEELIVTDHKPLSTDVGPEDGIGRRRHHTFVLDGRIYATICDFSLLSAILSSSQLSALRHSSSAADRKLFDRLIRSAASLDVVMRGKGSYKATAKTVQPGEQSRYTEAYRSPAQRLRLPASDYYSSTLP